MKKINIFALIIFLALFLIPCLAAAAEYVEGEVLVKFKHSAGIRTASDISKTLAKTGATSSVKRHFPLIDAYHLIITDPSLKVEEVIGRLVSDPNVEYAEPNYCRHILINTPNDTHFSKLWGLNNTGQTVNGDPGTSDADMDMPEAWDITTGSSSVVIAVLDTGVDYNHTDLSANIWLNPGEISDSADNDSNGKVDDIRGWNFVDDDNDPMDYYGHGTHVAGTIAAVGNNSSGVTGINWTAKIMPLRFLDALGDGNVTNEIAAIEYATQKGARIINASYGGEGFSQSEKNAIDAFIAGGGLFVAAAGNDGRNNDTVPVYPASYSSGNIISVAATDQGDTLASFSNYGAAAVDVAAPGVNIYSTASSWQTIWADYFDDGNITGWTTGGTSNTWDVTTEFSKSSSYSLTDSPGANYSANTNSWAKSPEINLTGKTGCKLTYYLKTVLETNVDFLYVEASTDGTTYTILNTYTNTNGTFEELTEDLSNYDNQGTVYIKFRLTSDSLNNNDGVYLDSIVVICASGTEYKFLDGTSMATPHVAGLAALIKARNPELTNTEIKNKILNSVDTKASLSGRLYTGGRVNALNALNYSPARSSGSAGSDSGGGGGGGGCFIATAAYGSPLHPYVTALREFRDSRLLTNYFGRKFVGIYYKYSPPIAEVIKNNKNLKTIAQILLAPMIMFIIYPYWSLAVFIMFNTTAIVILRKIKMNI